jgi:ACS family hexuronate transporter-like MFS transporter
LRRGRSLDVSRKVALGISAAMMPLCLLIAISPLPLAILFFSTALFGHQFWSTNLQTLPADLFPSEVVGSVAGLGGASGSFGGVVFNLLVGALLTWYGSYGPVFLIVGLLHPASFLLILTVVRKVEPLAIARPAAA